jgi:hypothetical protein
LGCPEVDFGPATVLENDRVNAVAEPSMTNSLHEIFRKQRWHIDLRAVFCPRLSRQDCWQKNDQAKSGSYPFHDIDRRAIYVQAGLNEK